MNFHLASLTNDLSLPAARRSAARRACSWGGQPKKLGCVLCEGPLEYTDFVYQVVRRGASYVQMRPVHGFGTQIPKFTTLRNNIENFSTVEKKSDCFQVPKGASYTRVITVVFSWYGWALFRSSLKKDFTKDDVFCVGQSAGTNPAGLRTVWILIYLGIGRGRIRIKNSFSPQKITTNTFLLTSASKLLFHCQKQQGNRLKISHQHGSCIKFVTFHSDKHSFGLQPKESAPFLFRWFLPRTVNSLSRILNFLLEQVPAHWKWDFGLSPIKSLYSGFLPQCHPEKWNQRKLLLCASHCAFRKDCFMVLEPDTSRLPPALGIEH